VLDDVALPSELEEELVGLTGSGKVDVEAEARGVVVRERAHVVEVDGVVRDAEGLVERDFEAARERLDLAVRERLLREP